MDDQRAIGGPGGMVMKIRDLPVEYLRDETTLAQLRARCDAADADPVLAKAGCGDTFRLVVSDLERMMQPGDTIRSFSGPNISGFAVLRDGVVRDNVVTVMS